MEIVNDNEDGLLVLRGHEVAAALRGRRAEIIECVAEAYRVHERGKSSLPHSTFLRFPGNDTDRIIALPAFLGDRFGAAGVKWISSFPANVGRGMARASAVLVLNSSATGRPTALLEASLVSAQRTAASAALAARVLLGGEAPRDGAAGLIGTGVINLEVARFLRAALPGIRHLVVFDPDAKRSAEFMATVQATEPGVTVEVASSLQDVLRRTRVVSFATTALEPHVASLDDCPPGAVILHVSLRDLTADVVLAADNVVDDVDHVVRANTSLHLAEQRTGGREFIRASLGALLEGTGGAKRDPRAATVFSPFGLGILDLAVGQLAYDLAREQGVGTWIDGFFPAAEV